jgi:hypothetical protein
MTRTQKTVFILVALIALIMGLTVNKVLSGKGQGDPTALIDAGIILLPQSRTCRRDDDQSGRPAGAMDELKGKWSLLFFGYTFCPDICPTTLAQLRQIKSELPKEAVDKLQVVLVSVDPNRDTPKQLKQYLGYFDPQFRPDRRMSKTAESRQCGEHSVHSGRHQQAELHRGSQRQPGGDRPGRDAARVHPGAVEQPEAGGAVAGLLKRAEPCRSLPKADRRSQAYPAHSMPPFFVCAPDQNAGTTAPLYFSVMNCFTSGCAAQQPVSSSRRCPCCPAGHQDVHVRRVAAFDDQRILGRSSLASSA